MRILFVAMANSVHAARWINQLNGQGWDIHLFPVDNGGIIHPDLRNLTVHDILRSRPPDLDQSVRLVKSWPLSRGSGLVRRIIEPFTSASSDRVRRLACTIRQIQPDVIHSLEIQQAGCLTLAAKNYLGEPFPPWIVFNWGSDIYLFGRLQAHVEKIKAVLSACDYYTCECHRDIGLARSFGFMGEALPVLPIGGSFDIERMKRFRQPGPTSARRLIMLKGYQSWAGRGLVGVRAIERCADALKGYRIGVYLAGQAVTIAAELITQSTGIPVEIIPPCSHEDILRLHGQARVSIGLNISDAASTSMLEAIVMGSFPIQSNTSCANEWIQDGQTGLIVPPEDPDVIEIAIRRAVSDDLLVDRAAEINDRMVAERLGRAAIQPQVIAVYEKVAAQKKPTVSNITLETERILS